MFEEEAEDGAHALAMPLVLNDAAEVKLARPEAGADVVLEAHVRSIDAHVSLSLEKAGDVLSQGSYGSPKIDLEVAVLFPLLF